jgi:hypothetical protein
MAVAFMLPLSFAYTVTFTGEYLFGSINGSAPELVRISAEYIAENSDVAKVVVYNDNGGDEIQRLGKYEKRLYTSPMFDTNVKIKTINAFSGHYLVIDAPPIDPASVYAKYLAACEPIFSQKSGYMSATVYDCRIAPDIPEGSSGGTAL